MTNQQAGGDNSDASVTPSDEAENHDAVTAITTEESHTEPSPPKQHLPKRLWKWSYNRPPWWVEQIFGAGVVGLVVSLMVGGGLFLVTKHFSDIQARQSMQLENLRFVRDRVASKPNQRFQFNGMDLEGQDLYLLPLSHASFRGAKLGGAVLAGTDLSGADLQGADLRGANLSGATLDGANLCSADLTGAFARSALLRGAVLGGANLSSADFQYTFLTGAKFGSSTFQADEFTQEACDLDFSGQSNLTDTDFLHSDFAGADLKDTAPKLNSAKLNHIHYDEKTAWPDGFRPPASEPIPADQQPPPVGQVPSSGELPHSSQPPKP